VGAALVVVRVSRLPCGDRGVGDDVEGRLVEGGGQSKRHLDRVDDEHRLRLQDQDAIVARETSVRSSFKPARGATRNPLEGCFAASKVPSGFFLDCWADIIASRPALDDGLLHRLELRDAVMAAFGSPGRARMFAGVGRAAGALNRHSLTRLASEGGQPLTDGGG
jgi:hypothetical protein